MCAPANKDVGIERFTNDGWCHGNTTFKISIHSVVFLLFEPYCLNLTRSPFDRAKYINFIKSQNSN